MLCPLAVVVDVPPDLYIDISSSDLHCERMCPPHSATTQLHPLSSTCPGPSSFFPVTESQPQSSRISAHAILHDMFLSQCVTGIRASVFHCPEDQLRKICLLHGVEVNHTCPVHDVRLCLLYHILNGDCITEHCESSQPSPDCTACLCISAGFSSPLSITSFVDNLLKDSTPSIVMTEDLCLSCRVQVINLPTKSACSCVVKY